MSRLKSNRQLTLARQALISKRLALVGPLFSGRDVVHWLQSNMTQASTHCWSNGQIKAREEGAPSVASISFHLGTGVFDGIMAYWESRPLLHASSRGTFGSISLRCRRVWGSLFPGPSKNYWPASWNY